MMGIHAMHHGTGGNERKGRGADYSAHDQKRAISLGQSRFLTILKRSRHMLWAALAPSKSDCQQSEGAEFPMENSMAIGSKHHGMRYIGNTPHPCHDKSQRAARRAPKRHVRAPRPEIRARFWATSRHGHLNARPGYSESTILDPPLRYYHTWYQ